MNSIHDCLFDARFQFDKAAHEAAKAEGRVTAYAMAARVSDWLKGLYAGRKIAEALPDLPARQEQAEQIEQWVDQIGAIVGEPTWKDSYHEAIWAQV
jgi:hypothetical protein